MLRDVFSDADRARKHGLDEYVTADPCKFNHGSLFKTLQTLTLDYRLADVYTCVVRSRFVVTQSDNEGAGRQYQ